VKISILKLAFVVAASAAALSWGATPSRAYGNEKWCAVTDQGAGSLNWDCEFETNEDCAPAVVVGNRGFCALNPTYRPPEPSTDPQH
jgi:hypothetical protein